MNQEGGECVSVSEWVSEYKHTNEKTPNKTTKQKKDKTRKEEKKTLSLQTCQIVKLGHINNKSNQPTTNHNPKP